MMMNVLDGARRVSFRFVSFPSQALRAAHFRTENTPTPFFETTRARPVARRYVKSRFFVRLAHSSIHSFQQRYAFVRSFVRSFVPACVRALCVILPRYPRMKNSRRRVRRVRAAGFARHGRCETRRECARGNFMRRFRDVSRAVRRRETHRRARRWTVGRRQTRRCVHLAVLGLARLCMGKQTDGWMDGCF